VDNQRCTRHLAEGVEGEEFRLLVRALGQVHEHQFGGQVQQRQHQLDAMGMAGLGEVVEFDHGLCSRVGTGVVLVEHMLR
jgi:hypothetical protein